MKFLIDKVLLAVVKYYKPGQEFTSVEFHEAHFPNEKQKTIYQMLLRLNKRAVLEKTRCGLFSIPEEDYGQANRTFNALEFVEAVIYYGLKENNRQDYKLYLNGVEWDYVYDDSGSFKGIIFHNKRTK